LRRPNPSSHRLGRGCLTCAEKVADLVPKPKLVLSLPEGMHLEVVEELIHKLESAGNHLRNTEKLIVIFENQPGLLKKIKDILAEIKKARGSAPRGYKGGKEFHNYESKLPAVTTYKEYDINPLIQGQNRGAERLVMGEDASVWFTADPYRTFIRIE